MPNDYRNRTNYAWGDTAKEQAYNAGQYSGNQASGVRNGIARLRFDDDGALYENPYPLDEVTVQAPDLRVAKAARDRPDYRGLNQFVAGSAFGPAGLTATLAANAMDHYVMRPATGKDWGSWMADKTGTAGGEMLGQPAEFWWGLTNPAAIAGGMSLGRYADPFAGSQTRSIEPPRYNDIFRTPEGQRILNDYLKKQHKLSQQFIGLDELQEKNTRTKVGDLEIDDPNVYYRQGKGIVDDFKNSRQVRTFFEEPAVSEPGWPNLVKDFDSPIFRKGELRWDPNEIFEKKRPVTADEYFKGLELYKKYHEPIDNPDVNPFAWDRHQLTDLLTTREELMPSDAKGVPLSGEDARSIFSDRYQIPKTEDQLNLENTTAWRYDPDYGFRRVKPDAAWEDGFLKYRTYTPTSEELSAAKSYLEKPTETPEVSRTFPDFQGGLSDTKPFLRYWDSLSPAVQKQMFEYIKNIYSNKHP